MLLGLPQGRLTVGAPADLLRRRADILAAERAVAADSARIGVATADLFPTVTLGLSGGVDSSVAAALLHKAIGDQLTCVFVDHGLLRHHEGDQVMQIFAQNLGVKVIRVDAEERFLRELAGVVDPEAKRKIIGRLFVEVFDEESSKLAGEGAAEHERVGFLAQGTISQADLDLITIADSPQEVVESIREIAMTRFGLTYGPKARRRWWLGE